MISTHVLYLMAGKPASGVRVTLARFERRIAMIEVHRARREPPAAVEARPVAEAIQESTVGLRRQRRCACPAACSVGPGRVLGG